MKQSRKLNVAAILLPVVAMLAIGTTLGAQPTFSKAFSPSTIGPGSSSQLTFTISGTGATAQNLAFVDILPAGVTIATPAAASTSCVNGILSAPDGGSTITLSGARLGNTEVCTVSVDVTSSVPGTHSNVSGTLTSTLGNSGTANADLTVVTTIPGFTKSFSSPTAVYGDVVTLTFTIDNSLNAGQVFNLLFNDFLPEGMVVASPTNASTTCTASWAPVAGANTLLLSGGSINAATTCTASVDVVAGAVGKLVNRTTAISGSTGSGGFASAALDVGREFLAKSFIDDPAYPGGPVTVEYTITNFDVSRAPVSSISFTDDFNFALTGLAVGGPLPATPCGAGSALSGTTTLLLTGGTLAAGATCTFAVPLTVPPGAAEGIYLSTTSVISTSVGPQPASSDDLIVKAVPLLTKNFVTDPVAAGSTTNLEFTITNPSTTSGATAITFFDDFESFFPIFSTTPLPAGFCGGGSSMTFFPATTQGARITVTGANLLAGTSCTFSVPINVPIGTQSDTYTNTTSPITGTISAETREGPPATDTLKVLAAPRLSKAFVNDPAPAGGTVTLEFTLSHSANITESATGITFTDDLNATLNGLVATGLPASNVCGAGSTLTGTSLLTLTGGNLAAGGTCTFSVTLQIPGNANPGSYPNTTSDVTATVGATPATSPAASDNLAVAGPGISKQFIPNVAAPGNTVSLEFTITNSSPTLNATGIAFQDDLNAAVTGMTATGLPLSDICGSGSSLSGVASGAGTRLVFSGGNLTSGASCTFAVPVVIPPSAAGEYTNATSTLSATSGGPVIAAPAFAPLTVLSGISMTKAFTNDPVYVGTTVDLQFTITNSDVSGTATGITFTDDLGAALSGLTATGLPLANVCGAGSSLSGTSVLTLTGGTIPAQSSCTFSVTLQVPYPISPWVIVNNVTSNVSGTIGGQPVTGVPASDRLLLDFTPHADMTVLKSGPATIVPGQPAVYTITVTNNGPYPAQNVSVTDTPSAGLVFTSNAGDCLTAFPCSLGTIAGGTSRVITSTFNVPSNVTGGPLSNTATVSSTTLDLVPGNNSSGTTAPVSPQADLNVTKAGPATVTPGQQVVYTITVTNNGPSDAPGVTLNDTPGAGLTFVSNTGACTTAFPCNLGTVTAGTSRVITSTFTLAPTATGSITNTASATSLVTDPNLGNNSATSSVNATPQADLQVTKTGPATVTQGENVVYTITVRNNGPSVANGVSVTDTPMSGLTFVSNAGDCTSTFPCSLGALTVGQTRTITSTFKLAANVVDSVITNTATASSAAADPNPVNNSSTASSTTSGQSDLQLSVSGPQLAGGEDFSFGITLRNLGPSNATGILLQIDTSPGVTFVSGSSGSECATYPCFIPTIGVNETRAYAAKFNLSGVTTSPMVTKIFVISGSVETNPADNQVIISTDTCPSATVDLLIDDGALDVPRAGTLTWNAINADSYEVYFGPVGDGCNTLVGTTTSKSFAYSGLEWRTEYEWRVVASKAGCPTGKVSSSCRKFTSGPPCPTTPPSLIFPPQGGLDFLSPIRFQWSAVPAATGYRVWASIDGTPAVVLGETSGDITSLVYQIIPGSIEWWVEVLSDDCTPIQSPSQTFTSSGSCVTRPAVLTSPADGATLTSPVSFDWEPVGGAKGYSVWVSVDGKFPVVVASTTTETQATARVSSGELRWFVESRYERCPPAISAIRTITVPPAAGCENNDTPQPLEPLDGQRLLSPIEFQWTPVANAIGYTVWASIDGDTPSIIATTDGAASVEQDIRPGLVEWFVQATFDQCPSTESTQASFTVLEAGSCDRDAPTTVFPTAGSTITDPVVRFEWTPVAGADEYRVWITVAGGEPQLLTSAPATLNFAEERVPIGQLEWYVEALFPGCPSKASPRVPFEAPPAQACETTPPGGFSPASGTVIEAGTPVSFRWTAVPGAFNYSVWLVREDGSPSIVATTASTSASARVGAGQYTWYVEAILAGCPSLSSQPLAFSVSQPPECQNLTPSLLSPADGAADLTSPITFVWTPVKGATGYNLWLTPEGSQPYFVNAPAGSTELIIPLPTGVTTWYVEAIVPGCSGIRSTNSQIKVIELTQCTLPAAPPASVVGEITTGETYKLLWKRVAGSTIYEVQQTTLFNDALGLPDYSGSTVIPTTDYLEFTAPELAPGQDSLKIYYRVRGIADCNQQRGPYGASVSVVVTTEDQSAQIGSTDEVSRNLTLCADEAGNVFECEPTAKRKRSSAEVSVDLSSTDEWLTVSPSSGTIPAGGSLTVTITADPAQLPTGTSTGAIVASTNGASRTTSGSGGSVPVSVGLASPVTPTGRTEPPPYAQIIPAVIHGDSATGTWQSDIRILNNASKPRKYQLNFTRSNVDGTTQGKQATVEIGAGKMLAFDDVVRSWYGAATQSLTGVLELRVTTPPSGGGSTDSATVAASRTYNNTPFGSYGQFVPAVSFSKFIGADALTNKLLLLQQLRQSSLFRTNVGLAESSGNPATVLISVFDSAGTALGQTTVNLKAGEHTQLNSLLAQMNITVDDARAEIRVTEGTGKITAYASMVDNRTLDPTFVPATSIEESAVPRRVLPGVADFDTGLNRWRSDARIYNSGDAPVEATLIFYPQGSPEQAVSKTVTVAPKAIRVLDDLLRTEFGRTNTGGAMHVVTTNPEALFVSARTYDQRDDGTVGQFIPSLTTSDAATLGGRVLNLLQVEESDRTRTNLGLVELSGESAVAEITAVVPRSLASPKIRIPLRPYEFIQLGSVFRQFGFDDVFNGRLYVRVVEGNGRVGAYASAIDNATGDPAYVPAQ